MIPDQSFKSKINTMQRFQIQFSLIGFCSGFALLVLAIYIIIMQDQHAFGLEHLYGLFLDNPLLWIVLLAPFILGIISWKLGKLYEQTFLHATELEEAVKSKTEELQKTNQELIARITEQKNTENELLLAKVGAEAAGEAKTNFLANISHELRTPLNHVLGFLQVVQSSDINEENHEYLKMAQNSGQSLLDLIGNIISYSDSTSYEKPSELVSMNLNQMIEAIYAKYLDAAIQKKLTLEVHFDPTMPHEMKGDRVHFQQVIDNLVSNAIKFTEQGKIAINIENIAIEKNKIFLQIAISDTGVGIDWNVREMIFDSFTQADLSSTRSYGGLGLGLALTKALVQKMGGEIWFISQAEEGSIFYVYLSFELNAETLQVEKERALNQKQHKAAHLLLVEDNPISQKLLAKALGKTGVTLEVADDGKQGLQLLAKGKFDLVLMDLNMPLMDGYEATKLIREGKAGEAAKNIPIIALTGKNYKGAYQNCLDAGMNDFLSKPIRMKILNDIIDKIVQGKGEEK